jgi:ElaB/YqjD/DUF883 family membrane-anchored ribosome-binding protein
MDYSKLVTKYNAMSAPGTTTSGAAAPTAAKPSIAATPASDAISPPTGNSPFSRFESILKEASSKSREILASKAYTIPKVVAGFASGGPVGALAAFAGTRPVESLETAAGMVKNFGKYGTQMTVQNPALAEGFGVFGGDNAREAIMRERKVPLIGPVKPLSADYKDSDAGIAQGPGETTIQAGSMYLEAGAPGATKLIGKAFNKVGGTWSKWGELLSNTPARTLEKAATPGMATKIEQVRKMGLAESPDDIVDMGEDAYKQAQNLRQKAMAAYGKAKNFIIGNKQGEIVQRSQEFVDNTVGVLQNNKIKIGPDGVDLVGSSFEGSASAKGHLDRAYKIMSRPVVDGAEAVDDLLTRREAITGILDDVPLAEKNLRRVIGDMVSSFDTTLESIIGKGAKVLRAKYAQNMSAANPVIKGMTTITDGRRVFSENRALAFMRKASTEAGFDQRKILSELDEVVGTDFAQTAEAVGIQKAIDRLDPITSGRVLDVVKALIARTSMGALLPMFSPRFWGSIAVNKGLALAEASKMTPEAVAAAKKAKAFTSFFLKNLLTLPVRAGADAIINPYPDTETDL